MFQILVYGPLLCSSTNHALVASISLQRVTPLTITTGAFQATFGATPSDWSTFSYSAP